MKQFGFTLLWFLSGSVIADHVRVREYVTDECYILPALAENSVRYFEYVGGTWGADVEYGYRPVRKLQVVVYDSFDDEVYDEQITERRVVFQKFNSGPVGHPSKQAALEYIKEKHRLFVARWEPFPCER